MLFTEWLEKGTSWENPTCSCPWSQVPSFILDGEENDRASWDEGRRAPRCRWWYAHRTSISLLSHAGRRQQRASGCREVCAQNSPVGSTWLSRDPLSFLLLSMWLGPEAGGALHVLGGYDGWTQASRPSEPVKYNYHAFICALRREIFFSCWIASEIMQWAEYLCLP